MKKAEMIHDVAEEANVDKTTAAAVLEAYGLVASAELAEGRDALLPGHLGKIVAKERAARMGRNPQTGESIQIPARMAPAFKASKSLTDRMNA